MQAQLQHECYFHKREAEKGVDVLRKVLDKSRNENDTVQSLSEQLDAAESSAQTMRGELEGLRRLVQTMTDEKNKLEQDVERARVGRL